MKWVVIGSGNVASHFAKKLYRQGHSIEQVYSPTLSNANELADAVQSLAISELKNLSLEADFYFIATSDNSIDDIVQQLTNKIGGIVIHCSGATPMSILSKFTNHGVIYPLQSISKNIDLNFKTLPLAIEGNNEYSLHKIKELAQSLSMDVFICNSQQRLSMHVSAVFANNFTNHLLGIAFEILQNNHISIDRLSPLILETIEKALKNNPYQVQTGPAIRNDKNTIQKHLKFLNKNPDWQKIYQLLSTEITKESKKKDFS